MGEIVFVRHGQASFGTDDYDRLSPLGWTQARWLGEHFAQAGARFDQVITGTMRRHRETTEAILEGLAGDHDPVATADLNELSYDHLHGDAEAAGLLPEIDMAAEGAFRITMPIIMAAWEADRIPTSHERFADFQARVVASIDGVTAPGRRVLVISSGGPKAMMLRHVLGVDTTGMTRLLLQTKNASVTRFGLYEDGLHLAEFNATPHLAGPDRAHAHTYI